MEDHKDNIGRLEIVPIRKVFSKEAQHFTTWMEHHIEDLSERLNIELSVVQREKEVGEFNVDLFCEDKDGHAVIIENQLGRTDHDHLGKLLTYLVNLEASTAIWVTSDPRPEHQKVIDWLNEATGADISFYLVKVEATKIGDSPYAPLFTVLAAPDKQSKETGKTKKEMAARHYLRREFWESLLQKSKEKTKLFSNISPSTSNWIGMGAGKSGVSFSYMILMDWAGIELYIDYDHDTGKKNKEIFDELYKQKDLIEKEFGDALDWERLDDKRACRIQKKYSQGGLLNKEIWPKIQDELLEAMIRFHKAIKPRLEIIKI
ncbi:MAG: DUF4268 domain-containing protein [Candidatus Sumerlaeota bacterium]|nr:DUF4268 domain-containing protein [Candidatus Sumerlaeota bacterium]